VKIYVAGVDVLRKKGEKKWKKGMKLSFITKIGGKISLGPSIFVL
jgi:hypothetical protein